VNSVVGFGWFRHVFNNIALIFDLCIDRCRFVHHHTLKIRMANME
jgi:hypothetical protein